MRRRGESTIDREAAGRRLDDWLSVRFPYHDWHEWRRRIAAGWVCVNGAEVDAGRVLALGDTVCYEPPELPEPEVDPNVTVVGRGDGWLAVNKSGNLPVHPAGRFFRHTLWHLLQEEYEQVHFVNRLDRETSGLVLVATDSRVARNLGRQFERREVAKEYLAVVEGVFPPSARADGFLGPDPASPVRKKQRLLPEPPPGGGDRAVTEFARLADNGALSLVSCRPETGRLHQLRVSLRALGFPLVGDKIYGIDDTCFLRFIGDGLTPEDRRRLRLDRQALHAWRLTFTPPESPRTTLEASPPPDLQRLLEAEGLDPSATL